MLFRRRAQKFFEIDCSIRSLHGKNYGKKNNPLGRPIEIKKNQKRYLYDALYVYPCSNS
jgi:predicted nucleic acid-binding protein